MSLDSGMSSFLCLSLRLLVRSVSLSCVPYCASHKQILREDLFIFFLFIAPWIGCPLCSHKVVEGKRSEALLFQVRQSNVEVVAAAAAM